MAFGSYHADKQFPSINNWVVLSLTVREISSQAGGLCHVAVSLCTAGWHESRALNCCTVGVVRALLNTYIYFLFHVNCVQYYVLQGTLLSNTYIWRGSYYCAE